MFGELWEMSGKKRREGPSTASDSRASPSHQNLRSRPSLSQAPVVKAEIMGTDVVWEMGGGHHSPLPPAHRLGSLWTYSHSWDMEEELLGFFILTPPAFNKKKQGMGSGKAAW